MNRSNYSGLALAISGAAMFSLKPILIKFAYIEGVDTLTLLTLRMVFALPFYLIIGLVAYRKTNQHRGNQYSIWIQSALVGIIGYYGASYLDMWGLTLLSAQLERLILFIYPTLVVLIHVIFYQQRLTQRIGFALLLSYAGIACIVAHDFSSYGSHVVLGSVLVFASAVCFAAFLVLSKQRIQQIGSLLFTCIAMSAAALAVFMHFLLSRNISDLLVSDTVLYLAFAIAVLSTVIPSFLVNAAIARIGAQQTSLLGTLGPVVTALLAVQLLAEPFTSYHLLGMLLVLVGVYLAK
jgi:drug/metabolite transporter (DMT)-like permease